MIPYNFNTDTWLYRADNQGEWNRLHASTYTAYLGGPMYDIPNGYAPAGEPFEHQLSNAEQPSIWVPLLKAVSELYTDYLGEQHTAYSLVPCLHQLDLETRELIAEHVLLPDNPVVEFEDGGSRFRNAVPYRGVPGGISGSLWPDQVGPDIGTLDTLRTPGTCAWGTIADCGGGGLHEILLIGDWAIPRVAKSNQLYAINLASGERYVRRGWRAHPRALARVRPDQPHEQDWSFISAGRHQTWTYSVLGRSGRSGRILVATERYLVEPKIRSDTGGSIEFELRVPECADPVLEGEEDVRLRPGARAKLRDSLPHKWVFHPTGHPDAWLEWENAEPAYLHLFYETFHPTDWFNNCGTTAGHPWVTTKFNRTGAGCEPVGADFRAALLADLEQVTSRPIWRGMVAVEGAWDISEWELPSTGDPVSGAEDYIVRGFAALAEPRLVAGEPIYYLGEQISRERALYGTRDMTYPDLNTEPVPGYPGYNRIVPDTWLNGVIGGGWEMPEDAIQSSHDSFDNEHGVGTMLHHNNGYSANSGVCAVGPGGPWIPDTWLQDSWRNVHVTQVWAPVRERAKLPHPPPHSLSYACDGQRLYFAPRRENSLRHLDNPSLLEFNERIVASARVVAIDMETGEALWSTSLVESVGAITSPAGRRDGRTGGCRSNPVLVADRLYLIAWGNQPGQIGVAGSYLVGLNRHTGEVEVAKLLEPALGGYPSTTYRDELVIVSASKVPEHPEHFFTISIVQEAP